MTPKMTPERKQELLETFARKGDAEPVEYGCCQLSDLTVGELRELLTEKVCEWTATPEGWTASCGRLAPDEDEDNAGRPCWCGGKVQVTR